MNPLLLSTTRVNSKPSSYGSGGGTEEVPREVDRQDDGERQQTHHRHEQDDVTLERQVRDASMPHLLRISSSLREE